MGCAGSRGCGRRGSIGENDSGGHQLQISAEGDWGVMVTGEAMREVHDDGRRPQ